ncbi:hypothetical protein FRC11_001820, partial [Ceratobasidium sp. 423]
MPKCSSDTSISSQTAMKTRAQKYAKVNKSNASPLPNAPEDVEEDAEEVGENDAVQPC